MRLRQPWPWETILAPKNSWNEFQLGESRPASPRQKQCSPTGANRKLSDANDFEACWLALASQLNPQLIPGAHGQEFGFVPDIDANRNIGILLMSADLPVIWSSSFKIFQTCTVRLKTSLN